MATPPAPNRLTVIPGFSSAHSLNSKNPTASPANANAAQGKIGKSHGCGLSRLCTPLIYDSRNHGSQRGRQVVHSGGASIAIARPRQQPPPHSPRRALRQPANQRPSTRSRRRSHSECPRAASRSTATTAIPARIPARETAAPAPRFPRPAGWSLRAICFASLPFLRMRSVTSATEIPARKRNSGAGKYAAEPRPAIKRGVSLRRASARSRSNAPETWPGRQIPAASRCIRAVFILIGCCAHKLRRTRIPEPRTQIKFFAGFRARLK